MPISRTSFKRLSLPASDWSIFRCAIERMSSPRLSLAAGRSVAVSSKKTTWFLPRAFAVIIAASAQATSSRGLAACSGPWAIPIETAIRPARPSSTSSSRLPSRVASAITCASWLDGHDHGELLAADAADHVGGADGRAQVVGELGEHLVADRVPEDVVHLLEVVDVDHHHGDVLVRARGVSQLAAEALVEVAVVVEAGERVGLRLALEPRADVRVVEGERRRVAEPLGELELLVAERRVGRRSGRR